MWSVPSARKLASSEATISCSMRSPLGGIDFLVDSTIRSPERRRNARPITPSVQYDCGVDEIHAPVQRLVHDAGRLGLGLAARQTQPAGAAATQPQHRDAQTGATERDRGDRRCVSFRVARTVFQACDVGQGHGDSSLSGCAPCFMPGRGHRARGSGGPGSRLPGRANWARPDHGDAAARPRCGG